MSGLVRNSRTHVLSCRGSFVKKNTAHKFCFVSINHLFSHFIDYF